MDGFKNSLKRLPSADAKSIGRLVFVLCFAIAGALALLSVASIVLNFLFTAINRVTSHGAGEPNPFAANWLSSVGFTLLGALLGSFLGGRILAGLERLGSLWDKMDASDKVTMFIGIFAGLVASIPVLQLFQALLIPPEWRVIVIGATVVGFSALAIYMLQTMADMLPWNRNKGRNKRSGVKILDTNVIIDGRIYDVAKTGFLEGQMYVPGFVLEELQYIADSHDALRRQRGRRGLDVLKHMQNEFPMEIRVHDKLAPDQGDGVDARLVRLAKSLGADIVTNDFNLNRVAALQDVKVMNLNDLALALRPNVLPTENLELYLSREGNQIGQGVGYLDDGTMVVVENGKPHLGETVDVVVTQVIQTERGKMIFAEVPGEPDPTVRRRVGQRRPTP
jgi:uncharacterized protein YacL